MTNASDPSSCVNCSNYIVSKRHEKHWRVVQQEAQSMLNKVDLLQATAMLTKLNNKKEERNVIQ